VSLPPAVAIANLVATYAERVDLGDFRGVGQLFAHGAFRAVLPDGSVAATEGAAAVEAMMQGMVLTYDGIPATKHVTTNLIIEVDDEGRTATCRSYFTVLQQRPDLPLQPIIAGRYHDQFEAVEGAWRFTDRLVFTDLLGELSRHLRVDPYR
jgi:SnoaL-like protein